MRTYLKLFCLALPIMIALDASWIGIIANGFYRSSLGPVLSTSPNFLAAGVFYIIYIIGLIFFAIKPALDEHSLAKAVVWGGALGLVSYATCDLTNLATVVGWTFIVTVVDMAWGVIISGVTAGLTYLVATKVFRI